MSTKRTESYKSELRRFSMTDAFKQVQKALEKLPAVLQEKVVQGAARAAAKTISDEAKENVPVDSGLLKKSIAPVKAKKADTPKNTVRYYVVPRLNVKLTKSITMVSTGETAKIKVQLNPYYAHMIEFGTSKMPAQPYLRPAYENSTEKSVKAFQEYALKRVDKEVEKLAR